MPNRQSQKKTVSQKPLQVVVIINILFHPVFGLLDKVFQKDSEGVLDRIFQTN